MDDYELLYKFVIIGDSGVGKTQLLERFSRNTFDLESKSTIGVEFSTKTLIHNNIKIKLQLWDTAGQERYRAITSAYYRGAVGVILCFDLTKHISFDNIIKENGWFNEANTNCSNPKYILVGTKSDLTHLKDINKTKIEEFIRLSGMPYIETSALDNTNIDEMMRNLVKEIYESNKSELAKKETQSNNINLIEVKVDKKDKKCCN